MLGKLTKKIFGSKEQTLAQKNIQSLTEELRNHYRYQPWHSEMITVTGSDGSKLKCFDISYGGIAIETPTSIEPAKIERVTIKAAGTTCNIPLKMAHTESDYTGYTFIHESGDSLLFLRGILEFMRCGSTLKRIPDEHLKQEKLDSKGIVWRGDGPSDLTSQDEKLSLTFRDGSMYLNLVYDGKSLKTAKTEAPATNGGGYIRDKTTPDLSPNTDTLVKALFLLAAIQDKQCQQLITDFVDLISGHLKTTSIV